jgi:hypothetical protein
MFARYSRKAAKFSRTISCSTFLCGTRMRHAVQGTVCDICSTLKRSVVVTRRWCCEGGGARGMLDVGCFILLFWFLRKLKGRVMSFLRMQGKKIKMIAAFFFFF